MPSAIRTAPVRSSPVLGSDPLDVLEPVLPEFELPELEFELLPLEPLLPELPEPPPLPLEPPPPEPPEPPLEPEPPPELLDELASTTTVPCMKGWIEQM
jgi:hypothetical protein